MIIYNIIPAAGKSKRMGVNKYLLPINNKSMIRAVVDNLLAANLENIYLVISKNSDIYGEVKDYNIKILINDLESSEMADSIRIALKHINANNSKGILITPADIPLVKVDTLNELIKNFTENKDKIIIPIYKGRKGHPVIFPSKIIYDLFNENTLRDVIKKYEDKVHYIKVNDKGILFDIDTEEDYKKIILTNELA
jgi:molybdenum cofactor cytidylyltransferase